MEYTEPKKTLRFWVNHEEKLVSFTQKPVSNWTMIEFRSSALYVLKLSELVDLSYRFM